MEDKKKNEFIVRDRRISSSEASGDSSEPWAEHPKQEPSNAERATGSSSEQIKNGAFP